MVISRVAGMKTSPGPSTRFVIHVLVKLKYLFRAPQSMFSLCIFLSTMYVISQSGGCIFKCTPKDCISRMRPGIVTLVSYTVKILFLFEVFLHWLKASKLGIKLDWSLVFFHKSWKLLIGMIRGSWNLLLCLYFKEIKWPRIDSPVLLDG